nr:DUF1549 domain-containing protein [Pirellula sp.]
MNPTLRRIILFSILLCCGNHAHAEPPRWVRGINLNGPEVVIDGRRWDGDASTQWKCNGQRMENKVIDLQPPLRGDWNSMIRSSRWGRDLSIELEVMEPGAYQVVLYIWEDNQSAKFQLAIQGVTVEPDIESGIAGAWKRLGPYEADAIDGRIRIHATGGDANISGIELWQGKGDLVESPSIDLKSTEATESIAFFEKRIRPILIDHCYACHSQEASELGGGLLLDSAAGWQQGGDSGVPIIVPGSPDRSLLVLAIEQNHDAWKMPPDDRLSQEQIKDLIEWVATGAVDPRVEGNTTRRSASDSIDWGTAREFWSLRPIQKPSAPSVDNAAWCANDIDAFVLASMNAQGLEPATDADPRSLLRRASYDLLGLPPSPEAVEAFAADPSQAAYEQAIDLMLNSRQYGERWGRHWLDVVRYSDTAGDNSDFPIPQMILYRDWVIGAWNQ